MVSNTAQTWARRGLKKRAAGRRAALQRAKRGSTPRFPVHPEGYDPNAPDARPSAGGSATGAKPE